MKKLFTLSILLSIGFLSMAQIAQTMEFNNVRALYHNRGQLFWDLVGTARYEVPKNSGKTPIFAAGLWLSATDENEEIHCAVSKYNSDGYDFNTGPLKTTGIDQGTSTEDQADAYNKIWSLTKYEIEYHIEHFESASYVIPEDILNWPAHGNIVQDYAQDLAPFIDVNDNGIYEPELGDYPEIKGDQSLYWIFNDNLGEHNESNGSTPLKVEIHAQAYSYACSQTDDLGMVINNSTFLEYRFINRSEHNYTNFSMGFFIDSDLGYAFDDYMGTHVGLNSLYFYNGDDMDGTGANNEYGENPPAQFITMLNGPIAPENDFIDNDNDGTIDEEGENCLLGRSVFFNNSSGVNGDPTSASQYSNYLNGIWKDNRNIVFGGNAYQPAGGTPAKYVFPGDSDPWMNGTNGVDPEYPTEGGWTEANEDNAPGDRRGLAISGPFDFNPNQELKFEMALVWSRGDDGALSSVNKGFTDVENLIEMYLDGTIKNCGIENTAVNEIKSQDAIQIYPNPANDEFVIEGTDQGYSFELLNLKGQAVMKGEYQHEAINIKHLSKGTYILKIVQEKEITTFKIIKL